MRSSKSTATSADTSRYLAFIMIGIALATFSPAFDGFVKGLLQGAAVALILLSVWALGARRKPNDSPDHGKGSWLPSRDEDQQP